MAEWTPEEDKFLKDNANKTARFIGDALGRTRDAVLSRSRRINVTVGIKKIVLVSTTLKGNKLRHPKQYTVKLRDVSEHQCRYTQEQGVNMRVCGLPVAKLGYCDDCYNVVYPKSVKLSKKEEKYLANRDSKNV